MDILDRFIKYIKIPTNSKSDIDKIPSTECQRNLAKNIVLELREMNLDEVYFDETNCYIYAILKGNERLPKIGFISHLDTSEEVSDENVNPKIIKNYDGKDVKLNDDVILKVDEFPDLKNHIGKTLITTDGTTLLGADDKSGIAEIMNMLEYFKNNKIDHGDIYVAFTPDEEVGRGTEKFDLGKFKVDFAYTVDGSSVGEISYENFNAATVKIDIKGISAHLGSAKNTMINSMLIANQIINNVPNERPENTDGRDGFYHLDSITGNCTNTKLQFKIRDFDLNNFKLRKKKLEEIVGNLNSKYNNCIKLVIEDTYYNMKEKITNNIQVVDLATEAMRKIDIEPQIVPIRGGTDGAELTYMGLNCPNLGTGGHNFHSIYEYICLEDMIKSSDILIEIVKCCANK